MNAVDILRYGHFFIEEKVSGLPEAAWYPAGVVGYWSVKDVVAHLASFEQMLVELLGTFSGAEAGTPVLDRFCADQLAFNDEEVERRQHLSAPESWEEYVAAYQEALDLLQKIPVEQRRQEGTLPWYGAEYSLDDFLVYTFYGHKREHGAQIDAYRSRLDSETMLAGEKIL